jgi:hypothetical protein
MRIKRLVFPSSRGLPLNATTFVNSSPLNQIFPVTPSIPNIFPECPVAVVGHRQEERVDLREIRLPVFYNPSIRVCACNLADEERYWSGAGRSVPADTLG